MKESRTQKKKKTEEERGSKGYKKKARGERHKTHKERDGWQCCKQWPVIGHSQPFGSLCWLKQMQIS